MLLIQMGKLHLFLLHQVHIQLQSWVQKIMLKWAARNGQANIVKLLISLGADINDLNNNGYSALLWAMQNEHYDIAKELIILGADINDVITGGEFAGCTVVTFAFRRGDTSLVNYLSENGAEVNDAIKYGYCAYGYPLNLRPENIKCKD